MLIKRGEIWWASLAEPRGSEPGFRRPVLIISSNEFNKSAIQTVIVAVISSNILLANAPGNFVLTPASSGLKQDSVVNISQLLTIDKSFLTKKVGRLPQNELAILNEGLKLVLSIWVWGLFLISASLAMVNLGGNSQMW